MHPKMIPLESTPAEKLTFGLRMCHYRDLDFSGSTTTWRRLPKAGGQLIDNYFVPEDSTICKFGGPTYGVKLPDGSLINIMACRRDRCTPCAGNEVKKTTTPDVCVPFVHRLEWREQEGMNVFRPILDKDKYRRPNEADDTKEIRVLFRMAGSDGLNIVTLDCLTCVEGSCDECD